MRQTLFFLAAVLLAGCVEEPPGDLRGAHAGQGFWLPDTVTVRLLGREAGSGEVWWGRLDNAERAWLETEGYEIAGRHIDSTATHYFRDQAARKPQWDRRTLMTERVYVRRADQDDGPQAGEVQAAEPEDRRLPADVGAEERENDSNVAGRSITSSEEPVAQRSNRETWAIVVGSVAEPTSAHVLVKRYEKRLSTLRLSVRPHAEDDTTRYRVVAGRFDSVAVRRALTEHRSVLPDGAWPLQLQ